MHRIRVLKNPVQNYNWGSKTFIPHLTGGPSAADRPQAELWMGSHPKAPSMVPCDGGLTSLQKLIQENPVDILGKYIAEKFSNRLPFLFKVLAAARPLSIQAHPDHAQAIEGFTRENRLKIPIEAPHRNYKDKNHKPEIICALTPFWALKGFRKIGDIITILDKISAPGLKYGLSVLRSQPDHEGLQIFFTALMRLERERQKRLVTEVMIYSEKHSSADPAFEWMNRLNQEFPGDIGLISPIFLNLILLQPGEAMFIPAGELHAYLEGAGIELMANSDNVLRGGLTVKHIDVPELLNILNFTYNELNILRPGGQEGGESSYYTAAEEFMLSVISIHKGADYSSPKKRSVEIMICTEGDAHITDLGPGDVLSLSRGTSIIVPASVEHYRIHGKATIYKATVPL